MDGSLVSLGGLLTDNQIYDIPVYQRGYAWEEKNLEDLWEDIYYLEPSKKHYFGTVLLKDSGKVAETEYTVLKRFDVIDGQQRLTTVLILLREIISNLEKGGGDDPDGEMASLRNYLRRGPHYKLNLPGIDGDFFNSVIIDGNQDDTRTRAQRLLADAKAFFRERLVQEQERQPDDFKRFLVGLKKKIDDLQLIQYQVNSDADAIRIFETVNDRGRPLSVLEKTKSFLMHASYLCIEGEDAIAVRLQELNDHFSRIYRHFEQARGTRHLDRLRLTEDDVHRYHYIIYVSPWSSSSRPLDSLKDRVRNMLRECTDESEEYTIKYARDLERAFLAVKKITDNYKTDTEGGMLSKIFMLERMGNFFPLLIACWLKFGSEKERLGQILRLLEAIIVRVYLVGGYRSNTAASTLGSMAHRVHTERLDYGKLISELKGMIRYYQDDDAFEQSLRRQGFYRGLGSRSIKYLLTQYEIHLRKKGDVPLALSTQEDILTSDYEVEHVWAQNPAQGLSEIEETQHKESVHKLGNLTIASKAWNISMGNKPFEDKKIQPDDRPSYSNSSLQVQKTLAEETMWDTGTISEREDRIVKFALERWTI